eukprot:jgi/Mesen1/9690/ME000680S09093
MEVLSRPIHSLASPILSSAFTEIRLSSPISPSFRSEKATFSPLSQHSKLTVRMTNRSLDNAYSRISRFCAHICSKQGSFTSVSSLKSVAQSKLRDTKSRIGALHAKQDVVEGVSDILVDSDDLVSYITGSPLLKKIGLSIEDVRIKKDKWEAFGRQLAHQLEFDEDNLSESEKGRIYQYYLPIFFWCQKQLELHQAASASTGGKHPPALVIGISAPQGCGKTTVVESLEHLFKHTGSVSIDDFYLTAAEQLRGNAGSHDLQLGDPNTSCPDTTRGDRSDAATWPEAEGPLDVILFEGWMLGFRPVAPEAVVAITPQLEQVNANLAAYKAWDDAVDSWIIVQVATPEWVYKWRLQAEVQMRAKGKDGMTDEQVADFVSRYEPAYRAYLPELYKRGPEGASSEHTLMFKIDQSRNPIE